MTNNEKINKELQNWGISPGKYAATIARSVVSLCSKNDTTEEVITKLSSLNKHRTSVVSAIRYLINKANFSNSEYLLDLKDTPREDITDDFLIKQIQTLCLR